MTLAGKLVIVTGATGFIGSALCARLLVEGAHVRGLGRDLERGRALAEMGVEFVAGDLRDERGAPDWVSGAEVVMHLAVQTGAASEAEYVAVNVAGTRRLAEASAQARAARFVFTSSIAALGYVGNGVVDETKPLRDYGDRYGDSKIAAERALNALGEKSRMEVVIARLGMVYGPRSPTWTLRMLRQVRSRRVPLVDGGQGTCYPVYVEDVVDGLLSCATQPAAAGETFLLVGDGPVTWEEYLGSLWDMFGEGRMPGIRAPYWLVRLGVALADPLFARRNLRYVLDMLGGRGVVSNRKAGELLGWRPATSLDEGMRRTEVWLREAGYL